MIFIGERIRYRQHKKKISTLTHTNTTDKLNTIRRQKINLIERKMKLHLRCGTETKNQTNPLYTAGFNKSNVILKTNHCKPLSLNDYCGYKDN